LVRVPGVSRSVDAELVESALWEAVVPPMESAPVSANATAAPPTIAAPIPSVTAPAPSQA
jgi:hypothetical protein